MTLRTNQQNLPNVNREKTALKKINRTRELWDNNKRFKVHTIRVPEGKARLSIQRTDYWLKTYVVEKTKIFKKLNKAK